MFQTVVTMMAATIAAVFTFSNYRLRPARVLWLKEPVKFNGKQTAHFEIGENNVKKILFPRLGAGVEVHGSDGEFSMFPWSQVQCLRSPSHRLTKRILKLNFKE